MTTATPIKHATSLQPRAGAPAGGSAAAAPTIDVVKILKKYLWVLVAAGVIGGILGVVGHFIWLKTYPVYEAKAIFQILPPTKTMGGLETATDEDEQERFAQTQVAAMKSDSVIQKVVTDPRLPGISGQWMKMFMSGGGFQSADATEWLDDNLNARLIPNTDYIQMSLRWKRANDITNVLGIIRETYSNMRNEEARAQYTPQRTGLEQQITGLENAYRDKQAQRDQILKTDEVDSLEQRFAADSQELNAVITATHAVRLSIEGAKSQLSRYEAELASPGGPTYSDELIQAIEAEPLIQGIHQTIASYEAQKTAMQRQYGPDHRQMVVIQNLIDSWKVKLDEQRQRLLRSRFDAIVDGLRNTIGTLTAQAADLSNEQDRLVKRLIDLTKTKVKVDDLNLEIDGILDSKKKAQADLDNLRSIIQLQTSSRVAVYQRERIPDKPVLPQIYLSIPAGIFLVLGATASIVFLRELLDQRVRGPGDVTMIPRTRLLGYVPDAGEDNATTASQAPRAFHSAPKGVVAESYRQLRAPLLKRLDVTGHKSIMIMAGMPGSGASSVASNLAEACAASGRRVLLIDANFRRPSQHRIFGLAEAPGLADVLAGTTSLDSAVRPSGSPNLDLLTAGAAGGRVVERLAGEAFSELLAAAGADHDVILIDVPPAIVGGDGFSVANRCDGAILVVKAYSEKRGLVSRIRNELSETRAEFLGVVINSVRASAGGYMRGNIRASQSYASESA